MIRIKVCGMRDPDNIREISALNPDFLGFIFYPGSKRYVGINYGMIADIPHEVCKVGVFVNEQISQIVDISKRCRLDLIQLHGSETPQICGQLKNKGLKVIKSFGIDELFDFSKLENYSSVCDFFLFDTKTNNHGGSGEKFNINLINLYKQRNPFFLSGGIGPNDYEYIRQVHHERFYAVDINSRFETMPAIKDPQVTRTFIHEIRKPYFI